MLELRADQNLDDVELLRRQLNALQDALRSSESVVSVYRQKVEEGLWSLGPQLSPFLQNLPCLAFLKDSEGRYLYANTVWEELLDRGPEEWLNKTDHDLWPEEIADGYRRNDHEVTESRSPLARVEAVPAPNGLQYWLVTRFLVNTLGTDGQLIGGVGVDITGRRMAEQALAQNEEQYRALFESALSGIYQVTPTGEIRLANPALVRMLGFDNVRELAGACRELTSRFTWHCPSKFLQTLERDGQIFGYESEWTRRDGNRIIVRETTRAVRRSDLSVLYYEGVVEDISDRRRSELVEKDCQRLLEMVARNEDLSTVLAEVQAVIRRQVPGAQCRVVVSSAAEAEIHGDSPATWKVAVLSGQQQCLGYITVTHGRGREPNPAETEVLQLMSQIAAVAIEQRQMLHSLEREAKYDRLTGLANRAHFEDQLEKALVTARPYTNRLALLWIDLDRFKNVNDTLGHRVGDILLREVADRLSASLAPTDVAARMGGDEFAVLLGDTSAVHSAEDAAEHLLESLRRPVQIAEYEMVVTASIGIARFPEDGEDAETLIRRADTAMYRVKGRGKNGIQRFEHTVPTGSRKRLELETHLRKALFQNELELFYQPQVTLRGDLEAFEALIRWNHPKWGLQNPAAFIPVAEETGLIVPIGSWVVEEACRRCAAWVSDGYKPVRVSVNVSPLQFYYSDFVDIVKRALEKSGLDPSLLEVELTENLVMNNFEGSTRQMEELRAMGVTVAIDDFGTGYSSLSYLQRLPADTLKLDQTFLKPSGRRTLEIVEAITMLGHSLGLRVVAEGVETADQLDAMRRLRVDLAQGFFIGRPVPPLAAESLFMKGGRTKPDVHRGLSPGGLIV